MKSVFTWSGLHFGTLEGEDLWSHHGKHVGRRNGSDIYAPNGRYLGEVMSNGRLKVNKAKAALLGPGFVPAAAREKTSPEIARDGFLPYLGFEDFPHPDLF